MPDTDSGHGDTVINKTDSSEDSIQTKGPRTRPQSLPHQEAAATETWTKGRWDLRAELSTVFSPAQGVAAAARHLTEDSPGTKNYLPFALAVSFLPLCLPIIALANPES